LASRMSTEQLSEASLLFNSISISTTQLNSVPLQVVRTVFNNHLQRCIRMPAGGAAAGGSQQTGFEMELVTAEGASLMFEGWPNRESAAAGRKLSWELRSMEDLAEKLKLEETGWGALQGKPMPLGRFKIEHAGVILIGPPFTVCWAMRSDRTTLLSVRFPLILWTEEDNVILPPDDAEGAPFYLDPPGQPGLHRDLFKTWGRRIAAELVIACFPMTRAVRLHLPPDYRSDSSSVDDAPITERSESPSLPEEDWRDNQPSDSSDEEGAHRPAVIDSSDEEGAHR
jgi:hypothetical protein